MEVLKMSLYPFYEKPNLLVFTCTHVLEENLPITYVAHHFEDNNWEFLCNKNHTDLDAVIINIIELCEIDSSINSISDLPVGHYAIREHIDDKWKICRIKDEPCYAPLKHN